VQPYRHPRRLIGAGYRDPRLQIAGRRARHMERQRSRGFLAGQQGHCRHRIEPQTICRLEADSVGGRASRVPNVAEEESNLGASPRHHYRHRHGRRAQQEWCGDGGGHVQTAGTALERARRPQCGPLRDTAYVRRSLHERGFDVIVPPGRMRLQQEGGGAGCVGRRHAGARKRHVPGAAASASGEDRLSRGQQIGLGVSHGRWPAPRKGGHDIRLDRRQASARIQPQLGVGRIQRRPGQQALAERGRHQGCRDADLPRGAVCPCTGHIGHFVRSVHHHQRHRSGALGVVGLVRESTFAAPCHGHSPRERPGGQRRARQRAAIPGH